MNERSDANGAIKRPSEAAWATSFLHQRLLSPEIASLVEIGMLPASGLVLPYSANHDDRYWMAAKLIFDWGDETFETHWISWLHRLYRVQDDSPLAAKTLVNMPVLVIVGQFAMTLGWERHVAVRTDITWSDPVAVVEDRLAKLTSFTEPIQMILGKDFIYSTIRIQPFHRHS